LLFHVKKSVLLADGDDGGSKLILFPGAACRRCCSGRVYYPSAITAFSDNLTQHSIISDTEYDRLPQGRRCQDSGNSGRKKGGEQHPISMRPVPQHNSHAKHAMLCHFRASLSKTKSGVGWRRQDEMTLSHAIGTDRLKTGGST
jgi:hypothetical protein